MSEPRTLEEGANYRLTREGDALVATVWRRTDLSTDEGAGAAARMTATLRQLIEREHDRIFVLDLSAAPAVMGPRTLETIGGLVQHAAGKGRVVRIVAGPSATGRMQLERLAKEHGAAAVVASRADALTSPH